MVRPVKVLIVDDSKLIRQLLSHLIHSDPELEVVGTAEDPYQARELIKQLNPDVLTLDVEMPRMDGISFLHNLMRLRPMPVVMISSLTEEGSEITLEALELGAIDYIPKPKVNMAANLTQIANEICEKIKQAARVKPYAFEHLAQSQTTSLPVAGSDQQYQIIAIGASTGGIEATITILRQLPEQLPPIVITQHLPAKFTASYAKRANNQLSQTVEEISQPRTELKKNHIYIANGAYHLKVERSSSGKLYGMMDDSEPENRHKPSIDVLFNSVAQSAGERALAILLTGMGKDGANGMLKLHQAGATTIVQDQHSSVIWGMPRAAMELGAARLVLSLKEIAGYIVANR